MLRWVIGRCANAHLLFRLLRKLITFFSFTQDQCGEICWGLLKLPGLLHPLRRSCHTSPGKGRSNGNSSWVAYQSIRSICRGGWPVPPASSSVSEPTARKKCVTLTHLVLLSDWRAAGKDTNGMSHNGIDCVVQLIGGCIFFTEPPSFNL